jgi:release factor glutamine methyltransferase
VLGDWDFRRLTLATDGRALVPRPETEIVVERCLALLDGVDSPRVVDVGTGTGAIALALKHERPDARVTATDISPAALELARANATRLELEVELVETNLLAGVAGVFDLVVSNPPYVLANELAELEPEVRDWEPELALLEAGQTAALAEAARDLLDGWLVLEVHGRLAGETVERLEALGFEEVTIGLDLGGLERVVEARWEQTTPSGEQ